MSNFLISVIVFAVLGVLKVACGYNYRKHDWGYAPDLPGVRCTVVFVCYWAQSVLMVFWLIGAGAWLYRWVWR